VEGRAEPYKDAKLFPGGSRESNWRETGTNHVPGGMKECLEIPRETLEFLKGQQIPAHVLPTVDAANLYNQLAEKEPVGGLFHTTC